MTHLNFYFKENETTPNMHLTFISVIHTKDEQGNAIDKICARDFWRGVEIVIENYKMTFIKKEEKEMECDLER